MKYLVLACTVALGCGNSHYDYTGDPGSQPDLMMPAGNPDQGGGNPNGCGELQGCYTVYAHSDHVLYKLDLQNKLLVTIGPFNAPMVQNSRGQMAEDVLTDLAVAPDNTIYVISHTMLYTADPNDGHVTPVGSVTTCGSENVALTFTNDGSLYSADYQGAFCRIDPSVRPPRVTPVGMLGNAMAVAGDLVAVNDGTMYATAYSLNDNTTTTNNSLVTISPRTGLASAPIGATGFPKLYGIAFDQGLVFGFTHDGSGDVITIDPKTGKGTLYNKFTDPKTGKGISFAGAGVNAMVAPNPS